MRALILAAGATLAIAGCGSNNAAENTTSTADDGFEAIIANDTTAIDAATNDAANMAAESEVTLEPIEGEASKEAASREPRESRRAGGDSDRATTAPGNTSAPAPTTNVVANVTANDSE